MAKMTLDELVDQLRKAYGDGLRSVVLYGSAAGGEHIPDRSDHNVLVIADALPLERLRAAAATARAWAEAGNTPMMTLTTAEWRRSADVFPMEYADILERHRVLHGDPPFEGIVVRPEDLRHQLEFEARGKLLHLRQQALAAGRDGRRELALLEASLSAVLVLLRAVLRLDGARPPADNDVLVRDVAGRAGLDEAPLLAVLRHVRGKPRLTADDAGATLAGYISGVERLVAYVDQHAAGRGTA